MRTRAGVMLGVGVVVALVVAAVVLNPSLLMSAEEKCDDAIRERRFAEAVPECSRAFEAKRTGELAASVALAYSTLNKLDEAWDWAARPEAENQVRALRVRGFVLFRRGEVETARAILDEALQLALERRESGEASRVAHTLAGIHWDAGRYTAAYDTVEVAEREARRANDDPALAMAELAKGDIFSQLGDSQRADASFRRAVEATAQWPRDQGYAVLKLGLAYLNDGSPHRAEEFFRRARGLGETSGDLALLGAARRNLIDVLIDLGRHDEAALEFDSLEKDTGGGRDWSWSRMRARLALGRNDANAALTALDEISPRPTNEKVLLTLLQLRARALVLAGRAAEAERAWLEAIGLVEVLSAKEPERQGWVVSGRREPFDDLFVHLVERNDHLRAWDVVTRYARAEALSTEMGSLPEDPRSLVEAAESLRARWRPALPGALDESEDGPRHFQELLVLHEAGDRLWAGIRRGDQVRFVEVGTLSDLDPHLHAFIGDPGALDAAERLGTAIWRAAGLSASEAPLLVRATGRLNRLAMAALRVDGDFWIQRRAIARIPAVATSAAESIFDGAPLLAGDPGGDLAAARDEVRWAASHLSITALEGPAVTRDAVLSSRQRSLLHLATHARIALDGARIVVADGEVTTHDILETRPSARLVVLASCASGTGREAAGSDSLATAFLRAGSGAVLATLRSVPDTATQKLVRAFYVAGGLNDPLTALALAQRSLLNAEPPSVWSAFVISLGPSYTLQPERTIEAKR